MALELWRPRWGLARRGPWADFARMEREMEDLFQRFFGDAGTRWRGEARVWAPEVDMVDRQDEIVIRADLPGLEQKDLEVSVQEGVLTIRGERKEEREEKQEDYYCAERRAGSFARTLTLPAGVEAEKVRATFKNGVLEVHLPKTPKAQEKKIEIKAA
jgi:HSP20 family protein